MKVEPAVMGLAVQLNLEVMDIAMQEVRHISQALLEMHIAARETNA